ncbi:hypothetical protein MTO96_047984 [Rhipicephalus appendiculatus]
MLRYALSGKWRTTEDAHYWNEEVLLQKVFPHGGSTSTTGPLVKDLGLHQPCVQSSTADVDVYESAGGSTDRQQ